MRKLYFLFTALLVTNYCFGQTNTFPSSGKVGIGTTNPNVLLQVNGGAIKLTDPSSYPYGIDIDFSFTGGWAREYSFSYNGTGKLFSLGVLGDDSTLDYGYIGGNTLGNTACASPWMVFRPNGNIGIGTTSPAKKLDIAGDGINLENTTNTNQHGIIFKNGIPFISDFNYGNNGTVTTVGYNTFIGLNAGNFTMGSTATSSSQASYNTVIGYKALYSNTTGKANTAVGFETLENNTTGYYNTAIGFEALLYNATGYYNTAIGFEALEDNTTGINNTAMGYASLAYNTTGTNNTAIGYEALLYNTTGADNTALGYQALLHNTTGAENTASGYAALYNNTTGEYNTGYGREVLFNNSSGMENTANGYVALFSNTTGNNNTANGYETLYYNTTGNNNTTNGCAALFENTIGGYNTVSGYEALFYNTTGSNNTATGSNAGRYIANGSSGNSGSNTSVFIGENTKSLTASDNNEIVIGYSATGAGSNSVVLGNTSVSKTLLQGNVLIGKTSQTNSSYKLDVNGNIRANKVVVNASGADYVFDSAYQLRPLDSLMSYVKQNRHLPGIPSANQMRENGVSLGSMDITLLKQVEELTLYLIKQRKIALKQDSQIQSLKQENKKLRKDIELIKGNLNIH